MVQAMRIFMSKKSLLWRKAAAVLSVLTVLLAMVVVSPVETRADGDASVTLDLTVLYNDAEHNYYSNVVGEQVEITGPGTYTVTFDCAKDLQEEQTDAGITGLTNLTAIYMIDDLYLSGQSLTSDVDAFDFKYDSIVLDGTELELIDQEEQSGLKSAGQIDTNGPINSWENCQLVDGSYTVEDHVLNFVGFENPQVIEITFTVTNVEFKGAATETPEETTEEATEETTEESTEEVTEAATEAATDVNTEAATEAATAATEASSAETNPGSTLRTVLIVVLVIILIAVIVLVVKKLKK